jgi:cytidylate kinase
MSRELVIAVDGPSGAGKSTASRALAERLGYVFIDTGAMYRAVAVRALRNGVSPDQGEALGALAAGLRIELAGSRPRVFVDGEEVTEQIRTREASLAASRISAHTPVRRVLVARQREMGREGGVVMDGRDIGSVVFPDADLKFYVDAHPSERARRRCLELRAKSLPADQAAIEREIHERDLADSSRADSPLKRLPDAILVDTTHLAPEEVVERMLLRVERARAERKGQMTVPSGTTAPFGTTTIPSRTK